MTPKSRRSGGCFSFHFPRPFYQNAAVPDFIEHLGNQYNGLYKCVLRSDLT